MTCTEQGGFSVLCSDGLLYQIPSYIPASGNGAGYGSGSSYTVIGNNPSGYCPAGSLYDSSSGKCYSCPANSTYDSFSHNCNCDSGYTYSGSNCVSTFGFCESKYGINSSYNSLHDSCECKSGYTLSGSSCVSQTSSGSQTPSDSSSPTYQNAPTQQLAKLDQACVSQETVQFQATPGYITQEMFDNYGKNLASKYDMSFPTNVAEVESQIKYYDSRFWAQTDQLNKLLIKNCQPGNITLTTLCNGKRWDACPAGTTAYCPPTGDAQCVYPTKTNDQICSDKFGQGYKWDGTKNAAGGVNCGCKDGYEWNERAKNCTIKTIAPVETNNQICQDKYGSNSVWSGNFNNNGGVVCDCKQGFIWNAGSTTCVVQTPDQPVNNNNNNLSSGNNSNTVVLGPKNNTPKINSQETKPNPPAVVTETEQPANTIFGAPTAQTNSEPVYKLKWYQKIWNWFMRK